MSAAKQHIVIRGTGIICPLGHEVAAINNAYGSGKPAFSTIHHNGELTPVAALSNASEIELQHLVQSNANYKTLDRSVLMAVYAARQAAAEAGWLTGDTSPAHDLAVNIGSSRGATGLFEHHFDFYRQSIDGSVSSGASPTTTLGNLSSWVAHAVNAGGAQISHSITCSTALMAIANGVAWLKAGMAKRFLAGGTEAPLTPFTIAQMKAVGIYSKLAGDPFPCQPYQGKQNTFVLGEGAAIFALEAVNASSLKKGDVVIEAVGFGFEKIGSKTSISPEGLNFQLSMRHALSQLTPDNATVDAIITHTPGTKAGDRAELFAIDEVFKDALPAITTNKNLIGHTLGASGALSMQYGMQLNDNYSTLSRNFFKKNFYRQNTIHRVMVNAAGFGGNASSVIIKFIK